MKIININTGEIIKEYPIEGNNFFTTLEYWEEYVKVASKFDKEFEKKLSYTKFIKNGEDESLPKV